MLPKTLIIAKEAAGLDRMTANQLRERHDEGFGAATSANNRIWLLKRIAWRLRALDEGGLAEQARARATAFAFL